MAIKTRKAKNGGGKAVTKTVKKTHTSAKSYKAPKSTSVLLVKGRSVQYLKNLRDFLDGFQRKYDRAMGNNRKSDNLSILALLLSTELSKSLTDNHKLLESKKDDLESLLSRMGLGNNNTRREVFGEQWDELFDTEKATSEPVEYLETFNIFNTSFIKEYKKLYTAAMRGNGSALTAMSNMDAFADVIKGGVRSVFRSYLRILKVKATETANTTKNMANKNEEMKNVANATNVKNVAAVPDADIDDIINQIGNFNL
jgi:hypothetical protein